MGVRLAMGIGSSALSLLVTLSRVIALSPGIALGGPIIRTFSAFCLTGFVIISPF